MDEERAKRIQRMREAFANIDEEQARRIAKRLPKVDASCFRPGSTVALHFKRAPKDKSSDQ